MLEVYIYMHANSHIIQDYRLAIQLLATDLQVFSLFLQIFCQINNNGIIIGLPVTEYVPRNYLLYIEH